MVKPQDKEMKMQWITVDGRRTPIILPQIWDHEKEDWVVTSTENPLPTQLTGSNFKDGIVTKPRKVETFSEGDIKVSAGSFVQYDSFSKDLEYGTIHDMREYSHAYFGGQISSGAHHFYLLMRQKPFGTGGSMIIDDKTETSASSKYIKKTPITFHNLSLRVYNDSEEEQSYILAAGFWPV